MIHLLFDGQVALFFLLIIALVISLSFHEFGHAFMAKRFGDNTAQLAGRLTLNPLAHIDPMGLLMVVIVGIGYAKPVPTDPRNFTSRWADLMISAAGPAMNLLLAVVAVNIYVLGRHGSWGFMLDPGPQAFFYNLAVINMVLMVFNLIPLGSLDGHYMLPYLLTRKWAYYYSVYNARFGNMALMGLFMLSVLGVPVLRFVWSVGSTMLHWIVFV